MPDDATNRARVALARLPRPQLLLGASLVLLVGVVVFSLATDLFAYRSVNDDEGVYLLQAAMLLEGSLVLRPDFPAQAVQPWFFVLDRTVDAGTAIGAAEVGNARLYAKYSPVTAAVFAVGMALGSADLSLAFVAAANAALVYALVATAFDRSVALLSILALVASPLFLFTSAVFLPYAPTLAFELLFALAYVRAARRVGRASRGYALLAGTAIGVAFFARPYTAVLFALPFVGHALWVLARTWRARRANANVALRAENAGVDGGTSAFRSALARYFAVAGPGLAFVGVTLGYNALVVGDPLTFPYQAFGPDDGLGFGHHALLGYERVYTPALAIETTRRVVVDFVIRWTAGGAVGSALAVVGLLALFSGTPRTGGSDATANDRSPRPLDGVTDREVAVVVAGLIPSVIVGQAYFWGSLNGLENGLFDLLGPYYHFDLLLPFSTFAALGTVALWRTCSGLAHARLSRRRAHILLAIVLVVSLPIVAVAERGVVERPLEENRLRTANLAETYVPFDRTDFDRALVFTPDPYGDWQAHPFQYLRNDPGFDGPVVYATDGPPARDFRALDAADRTPYRFTYRGEWTGAVRPVAPELKRLRVLRGDRIEATTAVGVPPGTTSASVRIESGDRYARYAVERERISTTGADALRIGWSIDPAGARVTNLARAAGDDPVALPPSASEVDLVVTFVDASGASVTYRQEVTVERTDGKIRAIWPPETRVCRLRTECGHEGTWVGPDGDYLAGVSVETDARVRDLG